MLPKPRPSRGAADEDLSCQCRCAPARGLLNRASRISFLNLLDQWPRQIQRFASSAIKKKSNPVMLRSELLLSWISPKPRAWETGVSLRVVLITVLNGQQHLQHPDCSRPPFRDPPPPRRAHPGCRREPGPRLAVFNTKPTTIQSQMQASAKKTFGREAPRATTKTTTMTALLPHQQDATAKLIGVDSTIFHEWSIYSSRCDMWMLPSLLK